MSSRFSFGGDEHLFAECDEEMSFTGFFKALAVTKAVRAANFPGVSEVVGGNASYQIRFDPDRMAPDDLLREVRALDEAAENADAAFDTRIVEIPVCYDDPWTRETMMRFRDRHQDPASTDIEYCARINGFASPADFIAAHHGSPWFVSMVGFVCGVAWYYQMVERARQIQAPKYVRPRTDTPRGTIGYGGCFTAIYAVRGAGGYQMFGARRWCSRAPVTSSSSGPSTSTSSRPSRPTSPPTATSRKSARCASISPSSNVTSTVTTRAWWRC
jgi:urea carboxylase